MGNEVEENLTLFFRRFLNTPEEMDAHLGLKGSHVRAPGLGRGKPQIAVHIEVLCQVNYEKASEKESQILAMRAR